MSDQLPEGQSTPVESTAPQKPSRPKKLLPAIALVVIVGAIALGTSVMNNGSGEDNTPATNLQANNTEQEPLNEAEELAQAFNILSTLESRSLQDPSTQADLDRLEEIYNTSRTRQGKLTTLRGQKQSQLEQAMSRAGLTNLQKKDVRETKNARENFDTEIVAVLNPLGISQADKEAITSLAKTVAVITHDLRLIDRYLSNYLRLRASLCTTDDASNDPYTKGMVTMTHGGARKVDACIASNTQIRQYVCQNLREPSNSPTETDCAYGCSLGACKKGQINDLKWFDAATGGNELTEPYDEGHDFWLEVDSSVANPHNETLTYEISAYRALNNDNCTLANTTGAIQEGDNEKVRIGPINCNNSGTDTWTVRLKHGDAETAKKTVVGAIGATTMDSLDLVMTESTTINSPVTVTVKAVGSNGLPFDKYTGEFQFLVIAHDNSSTGTDEFSVSGDESVDFPLGGGRINVRASDGNTEKVFTDGFTFRRAGTFTIQVLNRDYEDEVTVIVTEPPVY